MRLLFISGTRADFGKVRPLIEVAMGDENTETLTFVTGMHMHEEFGSTWREFQKLGIPHYTYENGPPFQSMELGVASTIRGVSRIVDAWQPSHIIAHGDRPEPLAAAIVGALKGVTNVHIEGGEISGTVDESIRHAVSKLSNLHLVANESSLKRLISMGENPSHISILGSPELDALNSENLPPIESVLERYSLPFKDYAICIFHPVTSELETLGKQVTELLRALNDSQDNFVLIQSNNDEGAEIVRAALGSDLDRKRFAMLPSMRFEYFITLLKNANYIIGNSSTGVREAPFLGVPSINIGTRQNGRNEHSTNILHTPPQTKAILRAIELVGAMKPSKEQTFGDGKSKPRFAELLKSSFFRLDSNQKTFYDKSAD